MPHLTEQPDHCNLVRDAIEMLQDACYATSLKSGFWNEYLEMRDSLTGQPSRQNYLFVTNTLAKLDLIHSEVSEATEAVRKPGPDKHCPEFTNLEGELADIVIRVMDLAGALYMDLGDAVLEKMRHNTTRPFKHGKEA